MLVHSIALPSSSNKRPASEVPMTAISFNASAAYLLNRNVGLFLTYTYLKQESSGTAKGSSFTDNKLAASVALQF